MLMVFVMLCLAETDVSFAVDEGLICSVAAADQTSPVDDHNTVVAGQQSSAPDTELTAHLHSLTCWLVI